MKGAAPMAAQSEPMAAQSDTARLFVEEALQVAADLDADRKELAEHRRANRDLLRQLVTQGSATAKQRAEIEAFYPPRKEKDGSSES